MKKTLTLFRNIPVQLTSAQLFARKALVLPSDVYQALIGQLLGDAYAYRSSPTANTRIEWSFGAARGDYANYLGDMFSLYCNTGVLVKTTGAAGYRLKTITLKLFNPLFEMFYVLDTVTGKYVKVVPAMINELMTPVVLAHLIMGDGNFLAWEQTVRIYTNDFTHEDCVGLASAISNMGIPTTVRKDRVGSKGEQQYILAINRPHLAKLRTMVSSHMHKSMLYRIGI
jgi:hypothetical protein